MKIPKPANISYRSAGFVACLFATAFCNSVSAQPTAFTYQGLLQTTNGAASGLYDFQFDLFAVPSGGAPLTAAVANAVPVTNGLFDVTVDFGTGWFNGDSRWLEINVRTNGAADPPVTLVPRQPLTSAPYAIRARTATTADSAVTAGAVPWAGITELPAGFADGVDHNTTYSAGTGLTLASTVFSLNTSFADGRYWKRTGNAGTIAGSDFLGTTDNQALELKVNNTRALRLEPTPFPTVVNVVAGAPVNFVSPEAEGSVIGGGGGSTFGTIKSNSVAGDFATISGGVDQHIRAGSAWSTIGGGIHNEITNSQTATIAGGASMLLADSPDATIGGGHSHRLENANGSVVSGGGHNLVSSAADATVSGGSINSIFEGSFSTIGGGQFNRVSGQSSVIAGGANNRVTGDWSTVPGGNQNQVAGSHSLAAGFRARANHDGSFVWADNTPATFSSTADKQFAVRAANGVMVQSANTALDLRGGGALRVAGAGVGSSTPVFIHRATAANTDDHVTLIDHPLCNNDPNAILIVTQNWNPGGGLGVYNAHPVGVYYAAGQWRIFNQDFAALSENAAFNVLVFKP